MNMRTLSEKDHQRLIQFYGSALAVYGPDNPKAFHWITVRDQLARFENLAAIGDLSGCSVADIGCGAGDLYYFLLKHFTGVRYLGIDVVPAMIDAARKKYPEAEFQVSDIFSISRAFDYYLASGALTFNIAGGKAYYYDMIRTMYQKAARGVAFNMLDNSVHSSDDRYLAYSWHEVREVCSELTRDYKIVSGYDTGDFTVWMHKQ